MRTPSAGPGVVSAREEVLAASQSEPGCGATEPESHLLSHEM